MAYSLRYDSDVECIVLVFDGTVTMASIQEVAPLVARMCEETGCRRILNNMSAATIDVSFMELFHSPDVMEKCRVQRNTKRALVVPSTFEDADFLETVTRNRGHNLMVFQSIEKARKWLSGDSYD